MKETLYDQLKNIPHKSLIKTNEFFCPSYVSFSSSCMAYTINDPEIEALVEKKDKKIRVDTIRATVMPYETHPVIRNLIDSKQTIENFVNPIVSKAGEVEKVFREGRFFKKFNPEKDLFGKEENEICGELENILDIKSIYSEYKGLIVADKFAKSLSRFYGSDLTREGRTDDWAQSKSFFYGIRNAAPGGILLTKYFIDNNMFATCENKSFGMVAVFMLGSYISALPLMMLSTFTDQWHSVFRIQKPTEVLKYKAEFIDKTIGEAYG